MKFLIIAYYFPPIQSSGIFRNWNITRFLRPKVDSIDVVTTSNRHRLPQEARNTEGVKIHEATTLDYRTLTTFRPRKNIHFNEEAKANSLLKLGIRFLDSFPLNLIIGEGGLIYIISSFWKARQIIQNQGITHIYSSFRPMSDHVVAYLLKRRYPSVFWIADYRDLHVDPLYKNVVFEKFQHACNHFILRSADLVTTISSGLKQHLDRYHPSVYVFRNGVFLSKSDKKRLPFPQFTVAYTGSMFGDERNPTLFLEVIKNLKEENILNADNFQILYAGKDTSVWQTWLNRFGLKDLFHSKGLISTDEAIDIQHNSHINLLLTSALPGYGGILTGKFYEYVAAQQPILVLINGAQDLEFESIIDDLNIGLVAYNDISFDAVKNFILTKFKEWQQTGDVKPTVPKEKLSELSWDFRIDDFIKKISTGI